MKAKDTGEAGERARIVLKLLQGQLTVDEAAALAGGPAALDVWKTTFVHGGEAALEAIPPEKAKTVEELLQKLEADFKKDFDAWSTDCPLRRCQFDAYRLIKENLAHYARTGRIDQEAGRFIIQMATGTGKTGVIALCAYFLPEHPRVLIAVPSDDLRSQLRAQLVNTLAEPESRSASPEESSFWKKIGIWPASRPTLRASAGHDSVLPASRHERHITITTPHSVTSYLRSSGSARRTLAGKYDLLIFDEGHKSAAPKWSDSAESVGVPLLLFTATPYRSDGRPLGAKPIYRFTYQEAVSSTQVLRPVSFRRLANAGDLNRAVDELVSAYFTEYGRDDDGPRLMVRAGSGDEVENAVSLFSGRLRAVGVHSQFSGGRTSTRLTSSRAGIREDTQVIVHQHMLLEGYDDPRVTMIAFLSDTDDYRVLVQQVGRAVRWNPKDAGSQRAIIYVPTVSAAEEAWLEYLAYENSPETYVFNRGRFCRRVEALGGAIETALSLRPAFQIRVAANDGKTQTGRRRIQKSIAHWIRSQRDLRLLDIGEHNGALPCMSFLFERTRTPVFLGSAFYQDRSLELLLIAFGKQFTFVQSSLGRMPEIVRGWALLGSDQLEHLIPARDVQVHAVQLRNLFLAAGTVRARSIWADDAARHVAFSRDGSFAPIGIGWSSPSNGAASARTLGFSSSRLSFQERGSLRDFLDRCKMVETELSLPTPLHGVFTRVARRTDERPGVPYVIQIDINPEHELSVEEQSTRRPAALETGLLYAELNHVAGGYRGSLVGLHTGRSTPAISVDVGFDHTRKRFNVSWTDRSKRILVQTEHERADLLRWIQDKRSYAVSTDNGVVSARGRFYRQREPVVEHLDGYLKTANYAGCTIEVPSSREAPSTPWPSESVFARFETSHAAEFDVIVCDDRTDEWADFVAFKLSPPRRLVMVHAKCSGGGAPAVDIKHLYVVCGQAVKNVFHLWESPEEERLREWFEENHKTGRPRLRKGGPQHRNHIAKMFLDPHVTREVWVIQASLDIAKLRRNLLRKSILKRTKRMAYQIDHTASSIAASGATFALYGQ